jgi:putative MATE family efflux protein
MVNGPLFPAIIQYTIPIIITSILQLLFHAADMVVVGRFCGSVSVAAIGATSSLINLIVNLFIGLSVGTGVTVAHAIGANENQAVRKTVHTTIPAALVSSVILTIIGVAFSEQMLLLMGTPDNVLSLSAVYVRIYFACIVFTMLYNFCSSILRAAGDTKSPLILLSISGVLNVILNLIFVLIFHMNVAGVAWATVISQAVSSVLVIVVLMKRTDACKLELRKIRFHKQQLMKIIRIGLPSGINSSLFSISNVIIQSSINSFGDVFMSGSAAAASIEGFVYVIMNAFSQAAVNFVGQNHGAHLHRRVKQTWLICVGCAAAFGLIASLVAYGFAPKLLSFYITDSQDAISYGILRMSYTVLTYFLCGMLDSTTGTLRGIGASFTPMIISILGICAFRIAWIYTVFQIPRYHTPGNLFISYPISWAITLTVELLVLMKMLQRTGKSHNIKKAAS